MRAKRQGPMEKLASRTKLTARKSTVCGLLKRRRRWQLRLSEFYILDYDTYTAESRDRWKHWKVHVVRSNGNLITNYQIISAARRPLTQALQRRAYLCR